MRVSPDGRSLIISIPVDVVVRKFTAIAKLREPLDLSKMSRREREIVDMILQGCVRKEIAARLNLGVRTVAHHISNILRKTKSANTKEMVFKWGERPAT